MRHVFQVAKKKKQYETSLAFYHAGKYQEAKELFKNLNYKKKNQDYSFELYQKCCEAEKEIELNSKYDLAMKQFEKGNYRAASTMFYELGRHKNSKAMMQKCNDLIAKERQAKIEEEYQKAIALFGEGKGIEAEQLFKKLKDYKDCTTRARECEPLINEQLYLRAQEEFNAGNYEEAASTFSILHDLHNYKDSCDMEQISLKKAYLKAEDLLQDGCSEKAYEILHGISYRYPQAIKLINSDPRLSQISAKKAAAESAFSEACMREDSLSEMRSVGIKC